MARVLIVDDEESIRDLIKTVLGPSHQFALAASGADALRILGRATLDLAIIDRSMPKMSGIEVVKAIRRNPKTRAMKILMCTANNESDEAFAAGADDYILKPISLALLRDKVAWALKPRA